MYKPQPLTTDDLERQMSNLKCAFPSSRVKIIGIADRLLTAAGFRVRTFNAWECLVIFINTFATEAEKRHWLEMLQTWWHLENNGKCDLV